MKHPAEFYVKSLLIRDPAVADAQVLQAIDRLGFLAPEETYLGFLRMDVPPPPAGFDPTNRLHRPSMQYLRDQQVYELFHPTASVNEAWTYIADPAKRMMVEELLLARLDLRTTAQKLNKKNNWFLTEGGLEAYRHYFWNVKLLTFDQWGRYLYERSSLYDRYMSLLQADKSLAFFLLRLDQVLESKKMIQRAQEIASFTLEEVNNVPGVRNDKIKAIGILTKAINDCHVSLSTSDMALSGVLKEFEKFRMEHKELPAKDIRDITPAGNFTRSGVGLGAAEKDKAN
jgi:hypothetical protein